MISIIKWICKQVLLEFLLQSGLSSRAKHGGTVFSAVSGSIKDLATVPGSYNHLGPWNFMTFAPALVFLTVVNIYSFAIEFGGCICYFWSKWISRAKFLTFPGDGRPRQGWTASNMQWLFMFFEWKICIKPTILPKYSYSCVINALKKKIKMIFYVLVTLSFSLLPLLLPLIVIVVHNFHDHHIHFHNSI